MRYTVAELIRELEAYNPDAEVRLASQPSWPFEYTLAGVTDDAARLESERYETTEKFSSAGYDDLEDLQTRLDELEPAREIVFICEGDQLQYGNRIVWESAGN